MTTLDGFEQLGLSTRDSRVYLALLKRGVSSIRVVADETGINRGSVYESIKALMAAGLVSFQQSNVNKKYFAEDPSKILKLIEQRKEELEELALKTQKVLPELANAAAYMPYANLKFYEDHEGVATVLRDVLDTVDQLDEKQYAVISSKPMRKYLYKKFPNFTRQRIKRDLYVRALAIGEGGDETETAERKWLPTKPGTQPSSYSLIYGDKFAIIGLNDNMNPFALVIEDAGVAAMQRLLFEQLWSQATS